MWYGHTRPTSKQQGKISMSRVERDLARLAQGAALVVARLAELRPLSSSGDSPTAATNAYTRWANAQNNSFRAHKGMNGDPAGRSAGWDDLNSATASSALAHSLAGTSETKPAEGKTTNGNESLANLTPQDATNGMLRAAGEFMLDLSKEGQSRQTGTKTPEATESAPLAGLATAQHASKSPTDTTSQGATAPHVSAATSAKQQGSASLQADAAESSEKPGMASPHGHRGSEDETASAGKKEAPASEGMSTGFTKHPDPRKMSRVPAGQFERVARFAGLGLGMAMGTVGQLVREVGRGSLGQAGVKGLVLNESNSDRLTMALCRMRGAALKLGQLLSIQDEHVIPKDSPLRQVIDRVREEAEQMPPQQLYPTLAASLGQHWRSKFKEFEDQPMAAASIGQVHRAVTHDGMQVAVKIQYPGVADSIDSDIANLGTFVGPFAPRGLFLSTALEELRASMKMETDYRLEAELTEKMRGLLADDPELRVPRVQWDLSSDKVLATELLPGVPFDQVAGLSQEVRNKVAGAMLRLTLRELFEFHLMQTDPNWSNFLYDEESGTLNLIDFGATMTYTHDMCYQYAQLVKAAVDKDREALLRVSLQMGFLTGEETPEFLAAHVGAAFITGEPFAADAYDFGSCRMTERNSEHISTMLAGRLTPPPRFVYTLHRKLSGAFLSCMRLKANIACRDMFLEHLDQLERRHRDITQASAQAEPGGEHSPLSAAPAV